MRIGSSQIQAIRLGSAAASGLKRGSTNISVGTTIPSNGLQLWLKADAGVITGGSSVTAWNDQSGGGLNFVSDLNAGMYPTLLSNGINGRPSISFINSFMGTADTLVGSGSDMTIFVVGYSRGESNGGGDLQTYINKSDLCSAPADVFQFAAYGGPGTFFSNSAWVAVDDGNYIYTKYPNAINTPRLLTMVNGGGALSLFINGSLHGTTAASITPQVLNKPIGIGNRSIRTSPASTICRGFGIRENLNGVISEVLIYNQALTTQGRQQVETYLNSKYAVY